MAAIELTRRGILQTTAIAAGGLAAGFLPRLGRAEATAATDGSMVLAWHTNIAPRWLDPLQHDGSATPDNFLTVVHDALIKNYKTQLYDHLALADQFEFAEDAQSATFRLRDGVKFHDGSPVTPDDVTWTYEQATWANWYEPLFRCGGRIGADAICVKDLDAKFDRYVASVKPDERKQMAQEIQREILKNYYFIPVFRHAFMNGIGQRIAATKWPDVFSSSMTTGYAYPWEEIKLKA